jgi:hypothetical protein
MFYHIEEDLLVEIESGSQSAADFLDYALTAHRMGRFVLALSRRQILRLNVVNTISSLSTKTLSFISNKSNDYFSAAGLASRVIRICTNTKTPNIYFSGRDVFVNVSLITLEHALNQKFVLGESFRDTSMLEILSKAYLRGEGYPESLIKFRALAGGGGNLCHVLAAESPSPIKGIVVCDGDTHSAVPPFPANTTGQKAWDQAVAMGLMGTKLGISLTNPFFAFLASHGRTIENMVRPNLLEKYFSANSAGRAKRADFIAAFPNYPDLSAQDIVMWQTLNLKVGTPNLTANFGHIRTIFGSVPMQMGLRSKALAAVSLPGDTIDWIIENWAGTKESASVMKAIQSDLEEPGYKSAVSEWAIILSHLAAGDVAAART